MRLEHGARVSAPPERLNAYCIRLYCEFATSRVLHPSNKEGSRGQVELRNVSNIEELDKVSFKLPIPMNDCSFSKRSDLLILLITHMHASLTIPGTSHFCAVQNLRNSEMSFNTKY
jgi:hypothetical protein